MLSIEFRLICKQLQINIVPIALYSAIFISHWNNFFKMTYWTYKNYPPRISVTTRNWFLSNTNLPEATISYLVQLLGLLIQDSFSLTFIFSLEYIIKIFFISIHLYIINICVMLPNKHLNMTLVENIIHYVFFCFICVTYFVRNNPVKFLCDVSKATLATGLCRDVVKT